MDLSQSSKLATLLILAPIVTQITPTRAQIFSDQLTPYYTPQECGSYLSAALEADSDSSGGLSMEEYFLFLSSVEVGGVADYIQNCCQDSDSSSTVCCTDFATLPWLLRVIYKTLACRCQSLGYGDGCCEGENAQVLLVGFDGAIGASDAAAGGEGSDGTGMFGGVGVGGVEVGTLSAAASEYIDDVCQQVAFAIDAVVPASSTTTTSSPASTGSEAVTTTKPAIDAIESMTASPISTTTPTSFPNSNQTFTSIEVRSSTLNENEPEEKKLSSGAIFAIIFVVLAVVVAGVLYDRKSEEKKRLKETDEAARANSVSRVNSNVAVERDLEAGHADDNKPFVVKSIRRYNSTEQDVEQLKKNGVLIDSDDELKEEKKEKKDAEEEERTMADVEARAPSEEDVREPEEGDDESSNTSSSEDEESAVNESVSGDNEDSSPQKQTVGSTLAAMGVASTVASRMYAEKGRESPDDRSEQSGEDIADISIDINNQISANLSALSNESLNMDEIRSEVIAYVERTKKPGQDPEKVMKDLLEKYKGREHELISYLKRSVVSTAGGAGASTASASGGTSNNNTASATTTRNMDQIRSEISLLVESAHIGKSVDDLMSRYKGREEELISHLRRLSGQGASNITSSAKSSSSTRSLAASAAKPSSSTSRSMGDIRSEIESLVERTNPGKSVDELMSRYSGMEEDLILHLKKLLVRKDGLEK